MLRVSTVDEHKRMSTQDLLLAIEAAVEKGETDFYIEASGQHDIGGPLWNKEGKKLTFKVSNPGQRVGSMCLPNTEILVEGSASADVGWLNAGGRIVVRGDAGDTAAHCAAAGTVYIGGRAGTRSGSLMKHDPLYEAPELWVLKSVGSFSFEFMGGGKAVVCGHDSQDIASVMGERSCVGMVGGAVYFRGPVGQLPKDVRLNPLDDEDIAWLDAGLDDFLMAIDQPSLRSELCDWSQWQKITPLPFEERGQKEVVSLGQFRSKEWIPSGIFSDVAPDDFMVNGLVARGDYRLRVPMWQNAEFAAPCEFNCPASIPTQRRLNLLREGNVEEAYRMVLDYTPFPGSVCGSVCPNPCMQSCTRTDLDSPVQIGKLGSCSADITVDKPKTRTGKHIGVIGGGVGCAIAYPQAKHLHSLGLEVDTIVGFRNKDIVILEDEFRACSDNLYLCTDDGSYGTKGFVTNVLQQQLEQGKKYDVVIAIGPVPMMKFVCKTTEPFGVKTIVSLNPIMVDGTGMCGGCRVTVGGKIKYACVDGPDFDGHQVDFDELMRRNGTYKRQEQECNLFRKEVQ